MPIRKSTNFCKDNINLEKILLWLARRGILIIYNKFMPILLANKELKNEII